MSNPPVRIAIVNDYEIVVAGTAAVLAPFADRVVVVELDSREPVVSDVDLVLFDTFGQVQGSDVDVDGLLARGTARVVVFSWNTDADVVRQSIEAGAGGYVSKGVDAEELVDALERIHRGEVVTPAGAGDPDGDGFGRWPGDRHGLSARESEVLGLICQGLSNEDITRRAYIGMNTLKTHIRNLYRKIGAESRTQAVLWGTENGFKPDRARSLRAEDVRRD